MKWFKDFSTAVILATVDKISKEIKSTEAFKYFNTIDSPMVKDYKEFNITILASAMTKIVLELDLKNPNNKSDLQNVYIGKSAEFIRKVMSQQYRISELKIDNQISNKLFKGNTEAHLCFQTHVFFNDIMEDLNMSLVANSAFLLDEINQPFFPYSFVRNIMLAKEDYDFEDYENETICISHSRFDELETGEIELLNSFILDLKSFIAN